MVQVIDLKNRFLGVVIMARSLQAYKMFIQHQRLAEV